jgi:hypothetical protein
VTFINTKWPIIYFVLFVYGLGAQESLKVKGGKASQTTRVDSTKLDSLDRKSSLAIGIDYASRVIFCGRDFGERQQGMSPYVLLNSRHGFYLYTIADFWSATPRQPARNVLGLGYEKQITKRFSAFVGYERWFNHYNDKYFDRAMQNELEAGFSYTLGKFSFEPAFYYFFGLERITQLDLTLARDFNLFSPGKNFNVSSRSEFTTTLATPVFAYIFYEFPDPNYDYEKFRLVDLEGSQTFTLSWGNIDLIGTARYNIPVNTGNESLKPFLYFTAELSYTFGF